MESKSRGLDEKKIERNLARVQSRRASPSTLLLWLALFVVCFSAGMHVREGWWALQVTLAAVGDPLHGSVRAYGWMARGHLLAGVPFPKGHRMERGTNERLLISSKELMGMTYSGLRMTQGQPASRMSPWYQSWGLPGDADTVQCGGKTRAEGGAAASLAKKNFGEMEDSWVGNSKVLPWTFSLVNTGHAKQQLEGGLGICVWPEPSSFTINKGSFSRTEMHSQEF